MNKKETGTAKLVNFGKLQIRKRKPKISYHPQTKKAYPVEEYKTVYFTPGKGLMKKIQ